MKVGIMSDSHDRVDRIESALAAFRERHVEAVIHAGDFVAPFAAKPLAASGLPVYAVYGNCDGERVGLANVLDVQDSPLFFELGGKTFCVVHDVFTIEDVDALGVDVLIHGHSHNQEITQGRTLIINPGEAGGWLKGVSRAVVLDTDTMEVEPLVLAEP